MQSLPVSRAAFEASEVAHCAALLAADRKALGVVVVDVRGHCSYTDFLMICSGTSDRHVRAIAEAIDRGLGERGLSVLGREGLRDGQWALLDAGGVIVHVFHPFTRQLYDLEKLWQGRPCERHGPPAPPFDMVVDDVDSGRGGHDPWALPPEA